MTCPPSHRERSATLQSPAWFPSPHFQKPSYIPFFRSLAPEPPTRLSLPKGLQLSSTLATGRNRGGSFAVLRPPAPPRTPGPRKSKPGSTFDGSAGGLLTGSRCAEMQPDGAPWLLPFPARSGPRPAPAPPRLLQEEQGEERREGGHMTRREGGVNALSLHNTEHTERRGFCPLKTECPPGHKHACKRLSRTLCVSGRKACCPRGSLSFLEPNSASSHLPGAEGPGLSARMLSPGAPEAPPSPTSLHYDSE